MKDVWEILTLPDPSSNKKVRWFCKSSHGSLGGIATSPEDLESVARLSHQGYDCFVTLNPTNDRICKRINSSDAVQWGFMLIDLDPVDDYSVAFATRYIKDQLMAQNPALGNPTIIDSGRGCHIWVRLPGFPTDHAENITRGFLESLTPPAGWRIDILSDLARIARLPGSINQKTGQYARLLNKGAVPQDGEYLYSWLNTNFNRKRYATHTPIAESHDKDWRDVTSQITWRAQDFVWNGAAEGSRHESCFACCKSFHEVGVDKHSAFDGLLYGNAGSPSPLTRNEVWAIVQQVYGREL